MHTISECLKQCHALVCCVGSHLFWQHGNIDYIQSKAQVKLDMQVHCLLGWQT